MFLNLFAFYNFLNLHTNNLKINILEESYKAMRNDGEKVYYKYRPLRRMNRCTEANPIELIDIKKREG